MVTFYFNQGTINRIFNSWKVSLKKVIIKMLAIGLLSRPQCVEFKTSRGFVMIDDDMKPANLRLSGELHSIACFKSIFG